MAWDKGDITTDITSQLHAKGGPKANTIQASTELTEGDDLHEGAKITDAKPRLTASQVLVHNQTDDPKNRAAVAPAQSQDGQGQSKIVSEEDRVEISADVEAQSAVSRQSDSRINNKPDSANDYRANKEDQNPLNKPGEILRNPSEQAAAMHSILSGPTPASIGLSENMKTKGMGFEGSDDVVDVVRAVDRVHLDNREALIEKESEIYREQIQKNPTAVEAEVGQNMDKLI